MEHTIIRDRNYRVDNIKAFLIFLVVLGHNMEPFYRGSIRFAYLFLYLFHMPLFVLCSGYFATCSVDRIKHKLIYPYLVFQVLYFIFEVFYYQESDYAITLFTPYWILWYLFSLIFWMVSLAFLEKRFQKKKQSFYCIAFFFLFGILVGFDKTVGMQFGLSRTIVFFPFFLVGYAMQVHETWDWLKKTYGRRMKWKAMGVFLIIFVIFFMINSGLRPKEVFGAYSYIESGSTWYMRGFLYLVGILLSLCIIVWMPKKKMFFSYLGQNSMQIFLFHAFFIKIFRKIAVYDWIKGEALQWIFLILSTGVLVFGLGSKQVKSWVTPLMIYTPRKEKKRERE